MHRRSSERLDTTPGDSSPAAQPGSIESSPGVGLLDALGIGLFEESVYRSLLRSPAATALELAVDCGAAIGDVQEALGTLERVMFVRRHPASADAWLPELPSVAVDRLVQKRQSELLTAFSDLSSVRDSFDF